MVWVAIVVALVMAVVGELLRPKPKFNDPKPSAEKIGKIAAVLEVTTEFLLTDSVAAPGEEVLDEAFFRKYKTMSEPDKKKIRKILDAWEDE